jgi:hypothetical protein
MSRPDTCAQVRDLAALSRTYPQMYVDCLERYDSSYRVHEQQAARWAISAAFGAALAFALTQSILITLLGAAAFAMLAAPRWHAWQMDAIGPLPTVHPEMQAVQNEMLHLAGATHFGVRRLQAEVALARMDLPPSDWASS